MKKILVVILIGFGLVGCTSIQVNNATDFNPESIRQVCIVDNPKVIIKDFNQIVERSFKRYNIDAKTYKDTDKLSLCQTTLNYTATRSWDMAPYLVAAQFNLLQNGRQVSEASFRLRGNGGLAPNKWRSTEAKINELVDQLLNKVPSK
ncbi:hypothetical protein I5523_08695 [Acinetobacter oleivorans]|uniref:Sbal_3080 family lipoprotein n=1 Tax=Acinetobacter oleivorans TaxID=1148157 RepID=UPI0018FFEEBD|nr:Sbal_3080 family lipoprotein [Acinetobacter oleivorans]MBJ9739717.1 hypothetical protein [Acinetobacter oleivorans]MCU4409717.1 hypothetical protein [Acinetobacter oleivorans]